MFFIYCSIVMVNGLKCLLEETGKGREGRTTGNWENVEAEGEEGECF